MNQQMVLIRIKKKNQKSDCVTFCIACDTAEGNVSILAEPVPDGSRLLNDSVCDVQTVNSSPECHFNISSLKKINVWRGLCKHCKIISKASHASFGSGCKMPEI